MTTTQIYFASPSGAAFALSVQKKPASMPSHGMYRAEIDAKQFIAGQSATEFLDLCLKQMKSTDYLIVGVHAGPMITFDINFFSRIGANKKSVVYRVKDGVPRNALESLANMPYGEFFVIGCIGLDHLAAQFSTLTDIEAALATLSSSARWAVGYDAESAILTVLAREEGVVKRQVMSALEIGLNGK